MRLLLDACVWGGSRDSLVAAGHDVVWAGEWPENVSDAEIMARALDEGRVLVTLDKDFGELAVLHGMPHAGIIRLVNWRAEQQADACLMVLSRYGGEIRYGTLVSAEPGRVRIRPQ